MLKNKTIQSYTIALFTSALLIGCGSGGGSSSTTDDTSKETSSTNYLTGHLLDSAVIGAKYVSTNGYSGITGQGGAFKYKTGTSTTFYVGKVQVGSINTLPGDSNVFIQDMIGVTRTDYKNPSVVKVAKFLQSLDSDTITRDIEIGSNANSFNSYANLQDSSLGVENLLLSAGFNPKSNQAVESHLKQTLINYKILSVSDEDSSKEDSSTSGDNTAPKVILHSPTSNQKNVTTNSPIIITFSEKIDNSTINKNNIIVTSADGTDIIKSNQGRLNLDKSGKKLTISFGYHLSPNKTYKVFLSSGILDVNDKMALEQMEFSFTTIAKSGGGSSSGSTDSGSSSGGNTDGGSGGSETTLADGFTKYTNGYYKIVKGSDAQTWYTASSQCQKLGSSTVLLPKEQADILLTSSSFTKKLGDATSYSAFTYWIGEKESKVGYKIKAKGNWSSPNTWQIDSEGKGSSTYKNYICFKTKGDSSSSGSDSSSGGNTDSDSGGNTDSSGGNTDSGSGGNTDSGSGDSSTSTDSKPWLKISGVSGEFKALASPTSSANAKSACSKVGGILVDDKEVNQNSYNTLASALNLQNSNKYWLEQYSKYIRHIQNSSDEWRILSYSAPQTAYPICKKTGSSSSTGGGSSSSTSCSSGWTSIENRCFVAVNSMIGYKEAKTKCSLKGGSLANKVSDPTSFATKLKLSKYQNYFIQGGAITKDYMSDSWIYNGSNNGSKFFICEK